MTEDQTTPPEGIEADLASTGAKAMHLLGVEYPKDVVTPSLDVEINAIEPPYFAPAGAQPYEGPAKRGLDIEESPQQVEQAIAYANTVFPNSNFTFIGDGRYGIVLGDETGKAFKVYRDALQYSRYEKEAGALQLLSEQGLAPRLHMFVDAGQEYRLDRKAHDYTEFGFEDVQIPRQNSGEELPILVMDMVDAAPLETAAHDKLVDGFCRIADVFIREGIYSRDAEIMVDKKTGELVVLDVGELFQDTEDELDLMDIDEAAKPASSGPLEILRGIAMDFGLGEQAHKIQDVYTQGGLEAVRGFLAQLPSGT